ncbi:MAG: hypothetical protein A2406_02300 [Candidatus Komeilibacteria bacterium RIFOXYC1_FULL_37_11]|uniref:Chorismate mutase domain-containing protein n=1 Tax=Candidatus Komeilibacteria bacterium RIFOXYC1_FULL_37_11 TaxID=1798555 RepID=A0A1G2BZP0_9BACT|nr:MAG: hypothetical protein A2406_02300 [Candidatus Komeilibacteria bacterium RIFOXYC1_FULL_37_11]OGY95512.1 MAG: hypothetical protein A2611_02325 [Candidatus Komeilibacteria bacterium RIFOXYD1_FULL_37_29]
MIKNNLEKIRKEIDRADQKIIDALALRFKLSKKIARFKNPNKIYDRQREKQIIKNVLTFAQSKNLNKTFIQKIYKEILKESKKQLTNILK